MRLVSLILILMCLAACGGNPHIRIANRSDVPLENVTVRFPSQTERYGTIPPHSFTDYREIKQAYRYAYIEATVKGQKAVLQPTDYVGETPLGGGRYTYALTVNEQAPAPFERLQFEFVRE